MNDPNRELTHEQKKQIADWKQFIARYESNVQKCLSEAEIQKLLNEIQDFIKYGFPEHLYLNIKKVTDSIFETSLILAEPDQTSEHHQKAGQLLYTAINELCKE